MIQFLKVIFLLIFASTLYARPSYSNSQYYVNEDGKIELRLLAKSSSKGPWKELPTLDGKKEKVLKNPMISPSDIEGISVEKQSIILYLKSQSWAKFRLGTLKARGERLAIIKDGKIITWPKIKIPVDRKVYILRNMVDLKWFLQGFAAKEKPPYLDSDQVYLNFLEKWIQQHPDDQDAIVTTAFSYISSKDPASANYKKAVPLFEKLIRMEPKNSQFYTALVRCYVNLRQYNKAIQTLYQLISFTPVGSQWPDYYLMGAIYVEMGNKKKALEAWQKSLDLLKNHAPDYKPGPSRFGIGDTVLKDLKIKLPDKKKEIAKLEGLIIKLKSSGSGN